MKKIIMATSTVAMAALSALAVANSPTHPAPVSHTSGFYVSGAAGYGHVGLSKAQETAYDTKIKGALSPNGNTLTGDITFKKDAAAWNANIGYQVNRYVGLEVGYMELPRMRMSGTVNGTAQKAYFHRNAILADIKAVLFHEGSYRFSTKIGLAGQKGHSIDNAIVAAPSGAALKDVIPASQTTSIVGLIGLGMDYRVNPQMDVSLSVLSTLASDQYQQGTYTGLIGVSYHFA